MYYVYYILSIFRLDGFCSGAGTSTLNNAISSFTKAEKKLNIAIKQFKASESKTKTRLNDLKAEFQRAESEILTQKTQLVDNRVKSERYLEKIKSFLED